MLHELFCAVRSVRAFVGFGLMYGCHVSVVYFVMLHWLCVCAVVFVGVFVCFMCVCVFCVID